MLSNGKTFCITYWCMGWKIILFIVRKRSLHHFEHECFGFGNDNTSLITFIQHVEQCSYNLTTTTETLSLKTAFPFKIAQKIKKEVRNFASDPTPFQSCCLANPMSHARKLATLRWGRGVKDW